MSTAKLRTLVTSLTLRTIDLSEEDVIEALRQHYNLPNAEVDIDCHSGFLRGATLTEKTEQVLTDETT